MRVAIVHDWLTVFAGSERVLEQMLACTSDADIFALIDVLPIEQRGFLKGKLVRTSFLQKMMPLVKSKYRIFLPLMPLAVEQLDLSSYDIVISSSHAVAKGVITGPDQLHLCMCYSPIRYAWDLQNQYLEEAGLTKGIKSWITRWILHKIRIWDVRTANGVDVFIAISRFIQRRIYKIYRRDSEVIYPPVDIQWFSLKEYKEDFYLTASRMVPYKKMELIVDAFSNMPDKRLFVIGDGPDFTKIKSSAASNVILLGYQSRNILRDYMQRAKAFVFAAEEDFGIAPLEAQACGTPVIAFGKGAALETIRGLDGENPTGVFFFEQTQTAIAEAIDEFERRQSEISPQACRDNALRFSPERFREEFSALLEREWLRFVSESGCRPGMTSSIQRYSKL